MKYYLKNKKNTASYNEEINDVILKIENIFGPNIANEIKNIRFYYEGFHNITYIGKFKNIWVQIRIPKNILPIDYANETKIVSNFKDYLYAKNGHLIKKWFPGQDLYKLNIDEKIEHGVFNCLQNFQRLDIKLNRFNWLQFNIKDQKYLDLIEKYKDEEYILSHNNIKRHNILVNKFGFIKLIDFEFSSYNSKYADPVSLHLFLGIDKNKIINFFNLDPNIFEDYIYIVQTFNKNAYETTYSKIKPPQNRITDSLLKYQSKDYSISNKFIIQKFNNQFDNRLDLAILENFYFVPICVYEDKNWIIWRWLNCNSVYFLNNKQIKALAHAMKAYHTSKVKFPSNILKEKIKWYLDNIDIEKLYEEIGGKEIVDEILEWISVIKPNANCHNNLNLDNIFFTDNLNIYIIDWSVAYYNNKYLDIAYMFENIGLSRTSENIFWRWYEEREPKDFYKYRIISHFLAYLYNKTLNGDYQMARINIQRILSLYNFRK